MSFRCLGGTPRIVVLVQQEILQPAQLVFRLGLRALVLGRVKMRHGLAHRRQCRAPGFLVGPGHQLIALAERDESQQALVGGIIGRRARPAQDAHRRGAAPGALVDAVQRHLHRRRSLEANYEAVQAMTQVGVAEFGMDFARVDLHAQVDIALADLDQVHTLAQLARQDLRFGALDVDLGGVFDQRLGLEPAHAAGKQQEPGRPKEARTPVARIVLVCSRDAAGFAHCPLVPCSGVNVYRHLRVPAIQNRKSRQGL